MKPRDLPTYYIIVGCSRTGLSKTLKKLQMMGLVRKVGARYEVVPPVPG